MRLCASSVALPGLPFLEREFGAVRGMESESNGGRWIVPLLSARIIQGKLVWVRSRWETMPGAGDFDVDGQRAGCSTLMCLRLCAAPCASITTSAASRMGRVPRMGGGLYAG